VWTLSHSPSRPTSNSVVPANATVSVTGVGTGILSAENCILACNARLALGTILLFYHLNAFAALSGSIWSKSSAKRGILRDPVETAFIVIQDASRGLIGTPPTVLHLLKSATPRARHLARTRRWKSVVAALTTLFAAEQVQLYVNLSLQCSCSRACVQSSVLQIPALFVFPFVMASHFRVLKWLTVQTVTSCHLRV
jgi:hypothetical protein